MARAACSSDDAVVDKGKWQSDGHHTGIDIRGPFIRLFVSIEHSAGRGRLPPRGDAATRCFRGTRQRDLEIRFEPTQREGQREG